MMELVMKKLHRELGAEPSSPPYHHVKEETPFPQRNRHVKIGCHIKKDRPCNARIVKLQ